MALVDERGRIAGRVNLIDAFVAVFVLVLIPVAFGAYLLFRAPPAKLVDINPRTVYPGPNLRIGISGRNLRPFMRVSFGTVQGRTFLIGSTEFAAVDLPDLEPGTYDIVLYDYAQELDRLPKAFTVLPTTPQPTIAMEVTGTFLNVPANDPIKVGQKFPPKVEDVAEVLSVGMPVAVDLKIRAGELTVGVPLKGRSALPATLRLRCFVTVRADNMLVCNVPGPQTSAVLAPDAILTLQGPTGWLNFQVAEVSGPETPPVARARVAFSVTPAIASKIKAGDADTSSRVLARGYNARIVSVERVAGDRVVSATLTVPIQPASGGWTYKREPFKIGAPFSFETAEYVVHGEVADVTWPASKPAAPGSGGER